MNINGKVALYAAAGLALGYAADRSNTAPTLPLIIITVALSIKGFANGQWLSEFYFDKRRILQSKEYYRTLSYGFLHLNPTHLLFNMLTLYSFAPLLYSALAALSSYPALLFTLIYLLSLIASALPDLFVKSRSEHIAVGASGAISSLIAACVVIQPSIKMYLFFIPLPIPGPLFLVAFMALSYYLSGKPGSKIGHLAHLSGAVVGLLVGVAVHFAL